MASSSDDLSSAVRKSKQAARLAVAAALKAIEYSSRSPIKARESALNAATQAALAWKAAHDAEEACQEVAKQAGIAVPKSSNLIDEACTKADECKVAAKDVVYASAASLSLAQATAKKKAVLANTAAIAGGLKKSVFSSESQQLLNIAIDAAVAATGAVKALGERIWK